MGMLDEKVYLTGDKGAVSVGEVFSLKGAKISGEVTVNGRSRPEVSLRIERATDDGPIVVFTTGAAIVSQVQRMDDQDRAQMRDARGMMVKLAQRGGDAQRNPAYVLVGPDDPDTDGALGVDGSPDESGW